MNNSSDFPTVSGVSTESGMSPARRLGKYTLVRPLGRGGMGEVWLADDTVGRVQVALKMLPPELRYSDEAQEQIRLSYQRVHGLQHPAICNVKDLVLDPQVGYFLVMEYFDGVTLSRYRHQYTAKHGSFSVEELCRVLQPIAEALDHAHRERIVHRDIKPTNILVSEDGQRVKVIDFQLASEIKTTLSHMPHQQADTSGTYPYLAPEQFLGGRANPKTDLYALGMVTYELLAGDLPFEAQGLDFWKGIVTDPRTVLPGIPGLNEQAFSALQRCLSREAADRQVSCTQFVRVIGPSVRPVAIPLTSSDISQSAKKEHFTHLKGTGVASDLSKTDDPQLHATLDLLRDAVRSSPLRCVGIYALGFWVGGTIGAVVLFTAGVGLLSVSENVQSYHTLFYGGLIGVPLCICLTFDQLVKYSLRRAVRKALSPLEPLTADRTIGLGVYLIRKANQLKAFDRGLFDIIFQEECGQVTLSGPMARTMFGDPIPSELADRCKTLKVS